jgi:hypothetical protein
MEFYEELLSALLESLELTIALKDCVNMIMFLIDNAAFDVKYYNNSILRVACLTSQDLLSFWLNHERVNIAKISGSVICMIINTDETYFDKLIRSNADFQKAAECAAKQGDILTLKLLFDKQVISSSKSLLLKSNSKVKKVLLRYLQ